MKATKLNACPIARTASLIGDEWILLLLRELFRGSQRFDDLQKKSGAATNIATSRLHRMIESGIVTKVPYQEHPPRYTYQLTKAGFGLFPVVMELMRYGEEWLPSDMPPVTKLVHRDCGKITRAGQTCSECGKPITLRNITLVKD